MAKIVLKTKNSGNSPFIKIGALGSISIDWGDDKTTCDDELTGRNNTYVHNYKNSGIYDITISGDEITYLDCTGNNLTSLVAEEADNKLETIYCQNNELSTLDVKKLSGLKELLCFSNSLESLDVTGNTNLETLRCRNNLLTRLDVRNNKNLQYLSCSAGSYDKGNLNKLEELLLAEHWELKELSCSNNKLESLNLSGLYMLQKLRCRGNKLTSLIVSGQNILNYLSCSANKLTSLNVSGLKLLTCIKCRDNQMSDEALNNLFDSLNFTTQVDKILQITGNPGTTKCSIAAAVAKNWTVDYKYPELPKQEQEEGADDEPEQKPKAKQIITLHHDEKLVTTFGFALAGSGSVSIDWGDGKTERYTLQKKAGYDSWIYHENSGKIIRKVTITCDSGSEITYFNGGHTTVASADFSGLTQLKDLYFENAGYLEELNVSDCINLKVLFCSYADDLETLDLSGLTNLTQVDCYMCTNLTELNVSGCTKLNYLNCRKNKLSVNTLNAIFEMLPTISDNFLAELFIADNPGTEHDFCNTGIAVKKNWWLDYANPDFEVNDKQRRKEINDYLRKELKFGNDAIQNIIDEEERISRLEGNYLYKYEDVTRHTSANQFPMNCSSAAIYPGALLVVDEHLGTMSPTHVGLARGSVKINILESTIGAKEVKADEGGSLQANINVAIQEIVSDHVQKNNPTAHYRNTTEEGESMDEISLHVGCSTSFLGATVGASFDMKKEKYARYYFTDFSHRFYTITAEYDKNDLSKLFADTIHVRDIQRNFGNKPLIFISEVNYGRKLHLMEEVQGIDKRIIQTLDVKSSVVKIDQSFEKYTSDTQYKYEAFADGGSVENTSTIFESVITEPPQEKDKDGNIIKETPAQRCAREMNDRRKSVDKFKQSFEYTDINGIKQYEHSGVVLDYRATRLDGDNPREADYWLKGMHKIKRLIPNTGLKIKIFNANKNLPITYFGYYTKFNAVGEESPTIYDIRTDIQIGTLKPADLGKEVIDRKNTSIFPVPLHEIYDPLHNNKNYKATEIDAQKWLKPEITLKKNIYRVGLTITDERTIFDHTYILPCGDIIAGLLRPGNAGQEDVNWYFGGNATESEDWYNGGKKE